MHALLCPVRERVDRYIADVISLGAAQSHIETKSSRRKPAVPRKARFRSTLKKRRRPRQVLLLLGAIWGSMQPIGIPMESHLITRTHAASAWLAQKVPKEAVYRDEILTPETCCSKKSSFSIDVEEATASSRPMHALLCPVRERVDRYIADVISLGAAQSLAINAGMPLHWVILRVLNIRHMGRSVVHGQRLRGADRYIADVISLGAAQSLAMHHASPHVAYV
jgi:hypothetical protein